LKIPEVEWVHEDFTSIDAISDPTMGLSVGFIEEICRVGKFFIWVMTMVSGFRFREAGAVSPTKRLRFFFIKRAVAETRLTPHLKKFYSTSIKYTLWTKELLPPNPSIR
jgi:hypothetical protein